MSDTLDVAMLVKGQMMPDKRRMPVVMPTMGTENANGANARGDGSGYVIPTTTPRRLTPKECERLQGFPDDWTAVDGMKDSPRYRMMGNAVTVNVAHWIGHRIMAAANG